MVVVVVVVDVVVGLGGGRDVIGANVVVTGPDPELDVSKIKKYRYIGIYNFLHNNLHITYIHLQIICERFLPVHFA